jgi:hypothetical protein
MSAAPISSSNQTNVRPSAQERIAGRRPGSHRCGAWRADRDEGAVDVQKDEGRSISHRWQRSGQLYRMDSSYPWMCRLNAASDASRSLYPVNVDLADHYG